jgi:hypothetical protein
MSAAQVLQIRRPEDLPPAEFTSATLPATDGSSRKEAAATKVKEKSSCKTKVNNTVVAPACATFSSRRMVSANASHYPFDPDETGVGAHGDDDGVRVRLTFKQNFMVHLGTYLNGVYHPKGVCNGRRLFCRSLGGGGCPHLFLYYLPDNDSWAVGMYPGDGVVYAVCGPAGDEPLTQPWHVWDGKTWNENPANVVTVQYKCDQQTGRWEDQATCHHKMASMKKSNEDVRRKLYKYAEKGGLMPLLEKGGVLQDHAIIVRTELAYEAGPSAIPEEKLKLLKQAWDVRVIDATDVHRFSAADHSPLGVAAACRAWCLAYNRREERCANERSWRYDPVVFTTQGHVSPEANALISLLSAAVATAELKDFHTVKAEMLRSVSASIPDAPCGMLPREESQ